MKIVADALSAVLEICLLSLALGACGGGDSDTSAPAPDDQRPPDDAVPTESTADTFDVGTWNIQWFGGVDGGPDDEDLQLANAVRVLSLLEMDLWAVQEIIDEAHFDDLVAGLPGYAGLLADDPGVAGGPSYYRDFDDRELKVGLIYRASMIAVRDARVILTGHDFDFAGRPPLQVELTVTSGDASWDVVVIVLHAKAGDGSDDWRRRLNGARALKEYLDTTFPAERVMVLGDFNDDVDASITLPNASPYRGFVEDSADYAFPTAAISAAGTSTTVNFPEAIDHHLITNEMGELFLEGTAEAFPGPDFISDYGRTTSDHLPVMSRYRAPGGVARARGGAQVRAGAVAPCPSYHPASQPWDTPGRPRTSSDLSRYLSLRDMA